MSNSKLVDYTKISPNSTNPRNSTIKKITIHHMAGNMSVETCGAMFARPERKASSNYGIGTDGRVALYVDEKNRSWCSGNSENDHQAITIEVANDVNGGDWHVSDKALAKLIDLCADVCQRNGIEKLEFTGDKTGSLTMHKWFQATACPGPYLESKFPYIAAEVNKRLTSPPTATYTVKAGDSWWGIADKQLGDGGRYAELAEYNGKKPTDTIYAGQVIKLPVKTALTAKTYTVKAGDSWWSIADKQLGDGTRYSELAKLNGKTAASVIHPGDVIKLP